MNKQNYIPEGVDFLEAEVLKSWLLSYAKQTGIEIIFDFNPELIVGINTSNLKEPKIYLNLDKILKKYNFTKEEFYFVLFHELEHLKEDIELRNVKSGEKIYEKRNSRLKEKGRLLKKYHELENVFRDVFVNNQVIHPTNVPALKQAREKLYKEKTHKETDFVNYKFLDQNGNEVIKAFPKHLQFIYAILREEMINDEQCIVFPEIRNIINRLKRNGILEKSVSGKFEDRLKNLWEYIEPIYKKLLEEDLEELKNQEKQQQGNNQKQENKDSDKDNLDDKEENSKQNSENQEGNDEEKEENGEEQQKDKGEEELDGNENGENQEGRLEENESGEGKGGEEQQEDKGEEKSDGNENGNEENTGENGDPFGEFSDIFGDLPHIIEDNISDEEKEALQKSIEEIIKEKIEENKPKSKEELELEKRAKSIVGGDDKTKIKKIKSRLEEYDKYLKKLEKIKDPETGNYIIDEIAGLFEKIKSKREKPRYQYKGPVDQEIGVGLDAASIAQGIGEILSGNPNPEMFEREIIIERQKEFVGKFDLTLIADGSGSMRRGNRNTEQKKAFLIIFEAIKKLNDKLFLAKNSLIQSIDIITRGLMFNGYSVDEMKEKSNNFTDKDRLKAFAGLDYCNGDYTNDYDGLDSVIEEYNQLSIQEQKDIQNGKIKKIVIVLSDGGSSDGKLLKKKIKYLREKGVLVYGVGITNAGKPVVNLYDGENKKLGFGQVCEDSSDLAKVLKDLLKEHLEKI